MTPTPFTWRDINCLIVGPLEKSRCLGCLFAETPDMDCPHTDDSVAFHCDTTNDVIFIEDTPKAMAEYVTKKLEGT